MRGFRVSWPRRSATDVAGAKSPVRRRLDAELVRRCLARSRGDAQEMITEGLVAVDGIPATKPHRQVESDASVTIRRPSDQAWVSRGGKKLADALADLGGPVVAGARAVDAGASTGGFTHVLLERGAEQVIAVDVGYGQLALSLRQDPRVVVRERTNVRHLSPSDLPWRPGLVVGDLSFISLRSVLPALRGIAEPDANFLLMVKPQFEMGRDKVGRGGVVRDPVDRAAAVRQVADTARSEGLGVVGVVASRWPGPSGNVEYFLWLTAAAPELMDDDLMRAINEGPA